jgi:hypothetical protein
VPGAFSAVIGPVYVPDVRSPSGANLLRVVAAPPAETDRALVVEWTQPALEPDVRFVIEARPADDAGARFEKVGEVAAGATPVAGRFRFVHGGRVPGRRMAYRVIAVREALDPADPSAAATRDIRGLPSEERVGIAISASPLAGPTNVAAAHEPGISGVRLAWTNAEPYERIAIYRRAPGRFGFELLTEVTGAATTHDDPGIGAGSWAYQLRAAACRARRGATSWR